MATEPEVQTDGGWCYRCAHTNPVVDGMQRVQVLIGIASKLIPFLLSK